MPRESSFAALHGIGVLVTRPEFQAMPLCRLLESLGATTLRLPAIEIKPCKDRRVLAEQLGVLENFDVILFTSANAVRFGVSFLDQKRDLTLAALGPATSRALNQAGYRVAIQPSEAFDSEGLLSHPRLEHVAGHRILIIKGTHGRDLIQKELTRRGATVVCADVYERVPADLSAAALEAVRERFAAGEVQVITATSLEIGAALLHVAPPDLRREFERAHWLVPGARVAAGLRELGLTAPLLHADSAENQDLVGALVRWRAGASLAGSKES
ncbi:MAG TPA: uroporphyrinogen-III synthase [Steroidobacteraceae bacterium]|jgi:uroporphyrinogen-III synthase